MGIPCWEKSRNDLKICCLVSEGLDLSLARRVTYVLFHFGKSKEEDISHLGRHVLVQGPLLAINMFILAHESIVWNRPWR